MNEMTSKDQKIENIAFIDGQNLYMGTLSAEVPWKIDFERLRIYLKEKYKVKQAYYYMGFTNPIHQKLYIKLQQAGFIVMFRYHSELMASHKKGNVDADIIFDIMEKCYRKEKFNKIILVSGDGDFRRMVDFLIAENLFEKILFPCQKYASSLYKHIGNQYFSNLDVPWVRKKIRQKKRVA